MGCLGEEELGKKKGDRRERREIGGGISERKKCEQYSTVGWGGGGVC